MEFSEFNEEDMAESIRQRAKHANTDVIEPWANARSNHRTLPLRREREEKGHNERKKTMDERIEEMYRKYSKQGMPSTREVRTNSREFYREMLKQFSKAQEFRQLGSRRQESELSVEQISMDLVKRKVNSNSCSYDYKEIHLRDSPPRHHRPEVKCADKFQRMLKIRDKVRKKNSLAVSKLKEKYLSEYNPLWVITPRQGENEGMQSEKERAKMRMRMRNRVRSSNIIEQPKLDFKIVGANSRQMECPISRSQLTSHSHNRPSSRLRQTMHIFNN